MTDYELAIYNCIIEEGIATKKGIWSTYHCPLFLNDWNNFTEFLETIVFRKSKYCELTEREHQLLQIWFGNTKQHKKENKNDH